MVRYCPVYDDDDDDDDRRFQNDCETDPSAVPIFRLNRHVLRVRIDRAVVGPLHELRVFEIPRVDAYDRATGVHVRGVQERILLLAKIRPAEILGARDRCEGVGSVDD